MKQNTGWSCLPEPQDVLARFLENNIKEYVRDSMAAFLSHTKSGKLKPDVIDFWVGDSESEDEAAKQFSLEALVMEALDANGHDVMPLIKHLRNLADKAEKKLSES